MVKKFTHYLLNLYLILYYLPGEIMSELINSAIELRKSLNLSELERIGIKKVMQSFADSHHTVTFPEKGHMRPISEEEIFDKTQEKGDISLYIHLPFCTGKCSYCQYSSIPNADNIFIEKYLKALMKEIDLISKKHALKRRKIKAVYIGGGTPTYLTPDQLSMLLSYLRKRLKIGTGEFTVEASPETIIGDIGKERLRTLAKHNVNRLSIGIQTFNDNILRNSQFAYYTYRGDRVKLTESIEFKSIYRPQPRSN